LNKVLALNTKGQLTYCTALPEDRGKGRCDHVTHQKQGQTRNDFIKELNAKHDEIIAIEVEK
jgi:hypothetical protein